MIEIQYYEGWYIDSNSDLVQVKRQGTVFQVLNDTGALKIRTMYQDGKFPYETSYHLVRRISKERQPEYFLWYTKEF